MGPSIGWGVGLKSDLTYTDSFGGLGMGPSVDSGRAGGLYVTSSTSLFSVSYPVAEIESNVSLCNAVRN